MTASNIAALDGLHIDVAIIGAGINGASAAQHLTAAGYSVLVVDQGDFANGATSRSSRLLHCGLRHLATGSNIWTTLLRPDRLIRSMGTVHADMLARDDIVRTIPNRVKPINFCLPIYKDDTYAPWQMDVAFSMLRMISSKGVPLDYRRYNPTQMDQVPIHPWLRDPEKLSSVAVFREYVFNWPERIALDALFDARRMGAKVHNYTRVENIERLEASNHWQLSLQSSDKQTMGEKAQVTADIVLNLAGAWVDDIIHKTDTVTEQKCAGMKGIHIAVQLPDEFADWGVFTFNSINEPIYCLPMNGIHYIGLTRTPFTGDASGISASDKEIDWMIAEANRSMPKLEISSQSLLFTWAGVNPLTSDPEEPLGSREIKIHDLEKDGLPGILALTGGPIMTHRRVANRLVRAVSKRISPSGTTQNLNYHWGDLIAEKNAPHVESNSYSVSIKTIERCAMQEQPTNLTDLMMRRLGAGWSRDQGLALAKPVAEAAAVHLGWSKADIKTEVNAYKQHLKTARRQPDS